MSQTETLTEPGDGDYPPYWDFAVDGAELTVAFKQFNQTNIMGRDVTVLVGDTDGRERSVFLWPEGALYSRFRDHIRTRPDRRIHPGERITVRRGEKRASKTNPDRQVWTWSVTFHDAPERTQADMFELDDDGAADDDPLPQDEDDPIPY